MTPLDRRLLTCIASGQPFSSDDVTDSGAFMVNGDHAPNSKQSSIGAAFRRASRAGQITPTGRVVESKNPYRHRGINREWQATAVGRLEAIAALAEQEQP